MRKRIVVVESPYAGDVARNERYARACLKDCLSRGEAPMASHLLYTQVLDDAVPEERAVGLQAGWAFLQVADASVVYVDLGVSQGMKQGMERAIVLGVPVERRMLGLWWDELEEEAAS